MDHGRIDPKEVKSDGNEYVFEVVVRYSTKGANFVTTTTLIKGPHAHFHGTLNFQTIVTEKVLGLTEGIVLINAVRRIE